MSALVLAGCTGDPQKRAVNDPCANNTDCADNICHYGICGSATPADNGDPCSGPGHCRSFTCAHGKCIQGKVTAGSQCLYDEECSNGLCKAGVCVAKSASDAGPDQGIVDSWVGDLKPTTCGNKKLDKGEDCDDTLLGNNTCVDQKFYGGDLACTGICTLDTSGCFNLPDATPRIIEPAFSGRPYGPPALASHGKAYLVAWTRNSKGELFSRMVDDASGAPLGSSSIRLWPSKPSSDDKVPDVAYDAREKKYLIVWQGTNTTRQILFAGQVSTSGAALGTAPIPVEDTAGLLPLPSAPRVAWGTDYFLVVWSDVNTSGHDIRSTRINSIGNVVDWSKKYREVCNRPVTSEDQPAVAYNGAGKFVVLWRDSRNNPGSLMDLYGTTVSESTGVSSNAKGDAVVQAPRYQDHPAVALGKDSFLAVWQDHDAGKEEIHGIVLDSTGKPKGTAFSIGKKAKGGTHKQASPDVAYDPQGNSFLVVWQDGRDGGWSIFGARIAPTGKVLNPQGFRIAKGATFAQYPRVARGDNSYMVVWQNTVTSYKDHSILGARVGP